MNPLAPSEIVVERSAISRNGGRGISIESGAGVDIKAVFDGLHVHHNYARGFSPPICSR